MWTSTSTAKFCILSILLLFLLAMPAQAAESDAPPADVTQSETQPPVEPPAESVTESSSAPEESLPEDESSSEELPSSSEGAETPPEEEVLPEEPPPEDMVIEEPTTGAPLTQEEKAVIVSVLFGILMMVSSIPGAVVGVIFMRGLL